MKHAFSLVELSIVLVILGLLTGGILTGQTLIRAAELRGVTTELERYRTAVYTFRDKYFSLPGDMTNATAFWGALDSADGLGADCHGVEATGRETCNGDGNGYMYELDSSTGGGNNEQGERFRFWQHLANAGLINGSYTGKTDSTSLNYALSLGKNIPASKLSQSGWAVEGAIPLPLGNSVQFPRSGGTIYNLIQISGVGSGLFAEEVWNVDIKLDNGLPGTGSIRTSKATSPEEPGCASTDNPTTAQYELSYTLNTCSLLSISK